MRYFWQALGKSLLAGILVLGVWSAYLLVSIGTVMPLFLLLFPFLFFFLDSITFFAKIAMIVDMIFWGIVLINLPIYLARKKRLKKMATGNFSPQQVVALPYKEVGFGYALLPLFVLFFLIFGTRYYLFSAFQLFELSDVSLFWYGGIPIFVVWCLLSWQWARYCLQDLAMKDKIS
ncbi:hypothetical protein [Entomospira culicis]|uniref:Uncharacterized protein n=1 Tax=Entomospira culicis TaxID=2719989 RepID=A0A968KZ23_9SPIO|nr:hypothetical protein [Entomospira culicis]NIZ18671.1 hypothetical protein [Entomospira culicis]NIZ68886.1 hypothetical protein [Entomospira culicis]WDI37479.1 hypothetical protein PVA46_01440 [Entomospira culicis]WDI39107.1 hypothetical protein PVA47_01445 [Entomospira culicis]